ncbi:MAG TPA: restriction endonuclease [Herpetosiphonaceae bacterium]
MKPGRALETLIEHLEKALSDNPNVTIESPKRLPDKVTGRLREHDVVLTFKEHHHELKVAFECRDRSRPVTVEQVEGFSRKCEDTGIQQGVLVSSKGFWETALTKAASYGIRCLSIEEATSSFDWLFSDELVEVIPHVQQISVRAILAQGHTLTDGGKYYIADSNGNELPYEFWFEIVSDLLFNPYYMNPDGSTQRQVTFHHNGDGAFIFDEASNNLLPVQELVLEVKYEVELQSHPFQFLKYTDKGDDSDIADVALSQLPFEDTSVEVGIVYQPGKGGKLIIVDEKLE